jgi:hypothetical protein
MLLISAGCECWRFFRAFANMKPKNESEKSESAERERKKGKFTLFPPSNNGSPVQEHKADRQREKEGS